MFVVVSVGVLQRFEPANVFRELLNSCVGFKIGRLWAASGFRVCLRSARCQTTTRSSKLQTSQTLVSGACFKVLKSLPAVSRFAGSTAQHVHLELVARQCAAQILSRIENITYA